MSTIMTELGQKLGSEFSRVDEELTRQREILEVADLTVRDSIPAEDRYDNMWVKTLGGSDADGNSTAGKIYYLNGGLSNLSWVELFEGVQAPQSNNSIDAAFFDGKDSSEWIQEIDSRVATKSGVNHTHDERYLALNGTADNATKLGGQLPAYFAEASRVADIETLLVSDDVALDSLQEVVNFVKTNRGSIDALTPSGIGAADATHNHDLAYLGINEKAKDSFKVNGLTVDTAVPAGAVFTDTVYQHPNSHPISMITGLQDQLDTINGQISTIMSTMSTDTEREAAVSSLDGGTF